MQVQKRRRPRKSLSTVVTDRFDMKPEQLRDKLQEIYGNKIADHELSILFGKDLTMHKDTCRVWLCGRGRIPAWVPRFLELLKFYNDYAEAAAEMEAEVEQMGRAGG